MSETFEYDVFLSHNQADKPRVRRLAERLRAAGLRVWLDEWVLQPGDDIYLAIERGLETAHTLVLCLSPAALGSDWGAGAQRRVGIHIGPMHVEGGDVFGGTVNFTSRVVGAFKGSEIWLSGPAKADIDLLGAVKYKGLGWEQHDGVAMKGFPGVFTLWSVQ